MGQQRKIAPKEITEFMRQQDANNDARISQEELFAFFKNLLKKYTQERQK